MEEFTESQTLYLDARFFEILTKVIFYTGFHRGVVERRWKAFHEAFVEFDIEKISEFDSIQVEKLLCVESGIVKNGRKVRATVDNARICLGLREEYGSLFQFLMQNCCNEKRSLESRLRSTFHLVGESAARSLVRDFQEAAWLE